MREEIETTELRLGDVILTNSLGRVIRIGGGICEVRSLDPLHRRPVEISAVLPSPVKVSRKVHNPSATPGRRGKRGIMHYVSVPTHAYLKEISEERDVQIKDLVAEGLNYVLEKYGKEPTA